MTRLTIAAASVLLAAASPALADSVRQQHINDWIADLCTVSDADLVGKRLARQCRAAVRDEWKLQQRRLAARTGKRRVDAPSTGELSFARRGD